MPTPDQMRNRYRALAYRYRSTPGKHGLRPHTVTVVDTAWTGAQTGDGHDSVAEVPIVEFGGHPPKVRVLDSEELALDPALPSGTVEIGPITPPHSGGGTDLALLCGRLLNQGDTHQLRITGPMHPDGALYRVTDIQQDKALHYTLKAKPVTAA